MNVDSSYKASAYSSDFDEGEQEDEEGETPLVARYDSTLSVNTVVERIISPRNINTSQRDSTVGDENDKDGQNIGDPKNDSSPRTYPMRRYGSYTLDKPSPLLQAHLLKFGSEEDISCHDMSQSQRHPHDALLPDLEIVEHHPLAEDDNGGCVAEVPKNPQELLDAALNSELEQFSLSRPSPPTTCIPDFQVEKVSSFLLCLIVVLH